MRSVKGKQLYEFLDTLVQVFFSLESQALDFIKN
jgi:hypothetical protein